MRLVLVTLLLILVVSAILVATVTVVRMSNQDKERRQLQVVHARLRRILTGRDLLLRRHWQQQLTYMNEAPHWKLVPDHVKQALGNYTLMLVATQRSWTREQAHERVHAAAVDQEVRTAIEDAVVHVKELRRTLPPM